MGLENLLPFKINAQISDIINYTTVTAVEDVYTLDLESKPIKNFRMTTADVTAKTVAVSNVSSYCELCIKLTYTNAAAITWFNDITWLNGTPVFEEGKIYYVLIMGTTGAWNGVSVGGW